GPGGIEGMERALRQSGIGGGHGMIPCLCDGYSSHQERNESCFHGSTGLGTSMAPRKPRPARQKSAWSDERKATRMKSAYSTAWFGSVAAPPQKSGPSGAPPERDSPPVIEATKSAVHSQTSPCMPRTPRKSAGMEAAAGRTGGVGLEYQARIFFRYSGSPVASARFSSAR